MANDIANGIGGAINGAVSGIGGGLLGAGIGALGGIASGIIGGNAEEEAYKRRLKAYNEAMKKAQGVMDTAESNLYNATDEALPELALLGSDINTNQNNQINTAAKAMQNNLAAAGVRGGQAATQLRRGIGDMTSQATQQLNQLKYDDASQRRSLRSAYEAAKAQAATNAYLQPFQG